MKRAKDVLKLSTLFAVAFVLSLQSGCNNRPDVRDIYDTNIKKVHVCYGIFLQGNGYKGPKDEQDFKAFLKTDPTSIHLLKRLDLNPDNLDEVFIGERDGESFVIRYGLNGLADHAIVFEQTGLEGKRWVAFADPVELDAKEYDDFLNGKVKAESPKVEEVVKPKQ